MLAVCTLLECFLIMYNVYVKDFLKTKKEITGNNILLLQKKNGPAYITFAQKWKTAEFAVIYLMLVPFISSSKCIPKADT